MLCSDGREGRAGPGSVLLWFFLFSWFTANETLAGVGIRLFRRRFGCFGRLRAAGRREEGGRRKEGSCLSSLVSLATRVRWRNTTY